MTKCKHNRTETTATYCWDHPVFVRPFTTENRRAHGNIVDSERCLDCGATRAVSRNQGAEECSPWVPSGVRPLSVGERAAITGRA